jgi:rhamnogalacturonan endolyase
MNVPVHLLYLTGCWLLLCLACTLNSHGQAAPEGLLNGGFEDSQDGPVGWDLGFVDTTDPSEEYKEIAGRPVDEPDVEEAAVVPDGHEGGQALHIRYHRPRALTWKSHWMLSNQGDVTVQSGETYTATAWIRGAREFDCGRVYLEVIAGDAEELEPTVLGHDMMIARTAWRPMHAVLTVPDGVQQVRVRLRGLYRTDLTVDDVEFRLGRHVPERVEKPPVTGFAQERVRERLDRGLVVTQPTVDSTYLSWRLLDTDSRGTAFNVYRRSGNGGCIRINSSPVEQTTDFVDENAPRDSAEYTIRPIVNGKESEPYEIARTGSSREGAPHISIPLAGEYEANRLGIGDLTGDGRYEYVINQPSSFGGWGINPWEGLPGWRGHWWHPSPDTFKLEAYTLDGTLLWRRDLGWSIEFGVWYAPFVVYDLDGDGRAEVAFKGADGDHRGPDGRVETGPEYVIVLDGQTGEEKARAPWPSRDGFSRHNYLAMNQLGVAYLDGKTPCLIVERGTYDTTKVVAYQLRGNELEELWRWDDREEGGEALRYAGQGAHCFHAADVDEDGRDEIIIGAAVIDDNGVGLWSTGLGHPDVCSVGDLDPSREGLEIHYGIEPSHDRNGFCMVDAATGKILWGLGEPTDHGHNGLSANILAEEPGVELWGYDDEKEESYFFNSQGRILSREDLSTRAAAYWDGDHQRELWQHGTLRNYPSGERCSPRLGGRMLMIADVLGDWREEVVTTLPGELRIHTTTIPAMDRRVCLMRDPIYRLDVCETSQAYYTLPGLRTLPGTEADR